MSRIYDALERARKEVPAPHGAADDLPPLGLEELRTDEGAEDLERGAPKRAEQLRRRPPPRPRDGMEDEMLQLHQSLEGLLAGTAGKIIEFLAAREGEGVSTIAEAFARTCATRLGKRVLILDAALLERGAGGGRRRCGEWERGRPASPWDILVDDRGDPRIRVGRMSDDAWAVGGSNGGPAESDPWRRVRGEFDLVLIDAPPASASSIGVALSGKADGTVLVMEAEKTRAPVVESLGRRIAKGGGRVLGIVLNKRRYHIPDVLYRQL